MKLLKWRYSLFLMPVVLWLPAENAQALTCQLDSFSSPNLGTITLANINSASIDQSLTYSCTNTSDVTESASICIGAHGTNDTSQINPRYMTEPNNSKLNFNMTFKDKNGSDAIWGSRNIAGGTEFIDFMSVGPGAKETKMTTIKVSLLPNNNSATASNYAADFTGINTAFMFMTVDSNIDTQQCSTAVQEATPFTFTVQATVVNACKINTTSNVSLGSRPASTTSFTDSNNRAIDVTCTNGAPYTVGLMPSNNNANGAGVMTGSNAEKVPYQLRSKAGSAGTIWGNTATSTDVGNGLAGTGSGAAQSQTVYVTVPSADFKPDTYSDTVTVHVNY